MGDGPTLADLGEWELIRRLADFAPHGQFNDDAALVSPDPGQGPGQPPGPLVLTTDVLVEGVHFSPRTTPPRDVGWRAAATNLSDLAAMGCSSAIGLLVGLVVPASTPWSWVEAVYEGLVEALHPHGGELLGGDCSSGRQRMLAITAIGRLSDTRGGAILRGAGRPGDLIVCTGPHGLSRLGLALLQEDESDVSIAWKGPAGGSPPSLELHQRAVRAHQRPQPRFDAVRGLMESRPASLEWRVAGCDSSDGLVAALSAITSASGCGGVLDRDRLPIDAEMAGMAIAETWCLTGGEDFELVLALDPGWAQPFLHALPGASCIGELVPAGADPPLRWKHNGAPLDGLGRGYQHFRGGG
jgi:thiamine-monophosphate kinase